jgi:pimeloyl-ACP methyl ester carboxylesterase
MGKLSLQDVDGAYRNVNYIDVGSDREKPPIVLLCGTAQTVNTFIQHTRHFSKNRRLVIVEMRCQGETELLSDYGTMLQHQIDFMNVMESLEIERADLIGFSFGGRLALAIAANYPGFASKISLSGVPLKRPVLGEYILHSWVEGLQHGHLRHCAWSFLLNGYSEEFIVKNEKRLEKYVDMICDANCPTKIYHLIANSHIAHEDKDSIASCASKVTCPTQIIGATQDRIAGYDTVRDLADAIPGSRFDTIDSGHLCLFEKPVEWRNFVLEFLNR